MRVALIIPGGIDPSARLRMVPALLWLAERLAHRHDLEVFSLRQFDRPASYEVRAVRVHDLGLAGASGAQRALLAFLRFRSALGARPAFDMFHGCWLGLPGALATLGAAHQRKPVVLSLMGTELVERPGARLVSRAGRVASRLALRRAARVTAGSAFLARHAAARSIRAHVVPLGVSPDWSETPARAPGPPWRLLHVASLNAWKDQSTLLRSLARIVRWNSSVHLDIVGEDTLDGQVAREVAAMGLQQFVTFHGFVASDDLRPFYRQAHVLLLPSIYEAQGVVVLEAAMHGLPTVGTAVGLVADGHGDWTIAVPVGDSAALADAVIDALEHEADRLRLGARAACWARRHDADWTAARFESLYEESLNAVAT